MAAQQTRKTQAASPAPVPPATGQVIGEEDSKRASTPAPAHEVTPPKSWKEQRKAFQDHTHALCTNTHRAGAVLRLMRSHFYNTTREQIDLDDVIELTDMLAELVPHHYTDINDPLDDFDGDARAKIRRVEKRADEARGIADALAIILGRHTTLDDLTTAAQNLYEAAEADDANRPYWNQAVEAIEARGLMIHFFRSDESADRIVVVDADDKKLSMAFDRAAERLKAAANAQYIHRKGRTAA